MLRMVSGVSAGIHKLKDPEAGNNRLVVGIPEIQVYATDPCRLKVRGQKVEVDYGRS